jgi:hypothetical protein
MIKPLQSHEDAKTPSVVAQQYQFSERALGVRPGCLTLGVLAWTSNFSSNSDFLKNTFLLVLSLLLLACIGRMKLT